MDVHKNYGSTRPGGAGAPPRVYRPWTNALAGFAVGYAARLVLTWALSFVGFGVAIGMGLSGAADPEQSTVLVWVVVGYLLVVAAAAVVVARYLGHRGATHPFLAALAAGMGGLVVQLVLESASGLLGLLAGVVTEIVLLGLVAGAGAPAPGAEATPGPWPGSTGGAGARRRA